MPELTNDFSLEEYISNTMLGLGVPAHLKGYRYLRSAIMIATNDMQVVGSVTKLLYPEVAKLYDTTNSKVERAIRNAIEISWERGSTNLFEEFYGYSNKNGNERPTNSEYIANIADQIQLRMREKINES
jgi:two-component system response regulator (stage 0 sporulation protein A)